MAKKKGEAETVPQTPPVYQRFVITPIPFDRASAEVMHARYNQAEARHNALRASAIEAVMNNGVGVVQTADEAFTELAKFTTVQCPYCFSLLQLIDNVHLANCTGMQLAHPGKPESWTMVQCKQDYPNTQTKSWLLDFIDASKAVVPPVPTSPEPPRPAVVSKMRSSIGIKSRTILTAPPMIQDNRPAVVVKKHILSPRPRRG